MAFKKDNHLIKDMDLLKMDKTRSYGITTLDNLKQEALSFYAKAHTFDAELMLNALLAMKHLNGDLEDVRVLIPLIPFPLIVTNYHSCYLIAPMTRTKK